MNHLAHALRIASTIACGIVLVAFAIWAFEETSAASAQQSAQIDAASNGAATPAAQPTVSAPATPPAEPANDGLRGAIDSANQKLVAPFDDVVNSPNQWVQNGVPALLALLAYGLLARLLIGYLPEQRA